ncbi:BppU family phage baseplate upper protein [Lactococcus lactis]|uniref:BppU family phage baseplate upper protein n=1 Tax=Lactococcus lactis TaxID=1358 RepID=UPI0032E3F232
MSDYSVTLSTTEPNNYVGLIKLRQGDVASQSIQATITANGQLFKFDRLSVFFNAVLPNGNVIRDKVTEVDYGNSKLNYIVSDSFLQEVAQVTAWFSFENGEKIIDSTKNFQYSVIAGWKECIPQGNYIYEFSEIQREIEEIISNKDFTSLISKISSIEQEVTAQLADIDLSKADKTQADSIQGQVNALVLGAVGDGNNAEVVQSKVDSVGSTFDTLKEHFDNVELMIKSNKTEIKRTDWFLAVYNAITGTATPYGLAETLVTPILSFGAIPSLTFAIDEGYRISIGEYSDATGTFVSNNGWYTSVKELALVAGRYYRIVIGRATGVVADVGFDKHVTITAPYENEVTAMRNNIFGGAFTGANDRVDALENIIATGKLSLTYSDWFLAVYNGATGGVSNYSQALTLVTNVKQTTNISGLIILPETGYKVYIAYYSSDGTTLVGNSGWLTAETFINVEAYDNIRFLIGKTDDSVATVDFKNHVTISIDFRPVSTKVDNPPYYLNLPPKIYGLVQKEMNVYFDNLMIDDADKYDFFVKGSIGKQQSERWTVVPTVADTSVITFQLYKDAADRGNPLTEAVTSLVVAPTASGSGLTKTYLQIGDSTTAGMIGTGELQTLFGADVMDLTQIGTQGTAPNKHEGYPTKTTEYVTTQTALANGGVFDFENYMTTQGYDGVDYVGIHLGINDMYQWQNDAGANGQITATLARFEAMVASIHAYNPAIKIGFLITIPPAKTEEAFSSDTGMTRWRYKRNVLLLAAKIIEQFKGREGSNIYLVPFNCNLDTLNNFGSDSVAVNSRNTTFVTRQNNALHPTNNGYAQMADTVYYWIKNMV